MYVEMTKKPEKVSWSGITFDSTNKAENSEYGGSFTAMGTEESGIFEKDTWAGLLSGDTGENQCVLSKVEFDDEAGTVTIKEKQQVSSVAPYVKPEDDDDGFPTWAIILIVVLVVVIVAVVVVIIVFVIRKKKSKDVGSEKE